MTHLNRRSILATAAAGDWDAKARTINQANGQR